MVGNVGLYYACYHLSRLDWNVMPTSRNARGVDIVCFSADGRKMITVQVKTLSKKAPVPLGTDVSNIMGDFWIIVNNAASESPACFILLPHEIRAMAHRGEKDGKVSYWLQPKSYDSEAFKERWDRIGRGL